MNDQDKAEPDFGERFEERAEAFGRDIDEKMRKLPTPVNALGDAACLTIVLVAIYYILTAFHVMVLGGIAWYVWLIVFAVVFVASVIIRTLFRAAGRSGTTAHT